MKQARNKQIGSARWREYIAAQVQSRQSITAYCRAAGVSESGFYQWCKRLNPLP
ncbi:MAG: hypothetical protein NC924_04855 [Candidatus Omnitrophica bacterium]|nr:hypothetical protein [Candidatus Omnitrophota bacterium]